jgi:hypothetical protein
MLLKALESGEGKKKRLLANIVDVSGPEYGACDGPDIWKISVVELYKCIVASPACSGKQFSLVHKTPPCLTDWSPSYVSTGYRSNKDNNAGDCGYSFTREFENARNPSRYTDFRRSLLLVVRGRAILLQIVFGPTVAWIYPVNV